MDTYSIIFQDLYGILPLTIDEYSVPYCKEMKLEQKVRMIFMKLHQALKLKNRILSLVNAFYLGQLLEVEAITSFEKMIGPKIVTKYYFTSAIRTYYIFQANPEQIYRTTNTTIRLIYQLKSAEYRQLSLDLCKVVAGAPNLGEKIEDLELSTL